jgi:hypothetical protein
MLLNEIGTRITGLVTGYAIDKGTMMDDTDKRIALYETVGFESEPGFSVTGVQWEHPGLQVVTRGQPTDYEGPRAAIETIYADLTEIQAATLSGVSYLMVKARQAPFFLKRDEKQRVYFAVNFMIDKVPS